MEKKTRQVVQTAEDPPNVGSSCFATIGSTTKSRKALRKMVSAYKLRRSCMVIASFGRLRRSACGHHKDVSHKDHAWVRGKVIYPRVTDLCNQGDVANLLERRYCSVRGSVLGE